jgi:hypothetical protein
MYYSRFHVIFAFLWRAIQTDVGTIKYDKFEGARSIWCRWKLGGAGNVVGSCGDKEVVVGRLEGEMRCNEVSW